MHHDAVGEDSLNPHVTHEKQCCLCVTISVQLKNTCDVRESCRTFILKCHWKAILKKQLCICDLGHLVVQVHGHEPVLWLHGSDHLYRCVPCKKWGGLLYQFHLYPRWNKLCNKTCTMKNLQVATGSLVCFSCDIVTTLGLANLLEWPKLAPCYLELLGAACQMCDPSTHESEKIAPTTSAYEDEPSCSISWPSCTITRSEVSDSYFIVWRDCSPKHIWA